MTRKEHLEWCKQRAIEYVDRGDVQGAIASMISDLGKHEAFNTNGIALACATGLYVKTPDAARRWIEGFN